MSHFDPSIVGGVFRADQLVARFSTAVDVAPGFVVAARDLIAFCGFTGDSVTISAQ